MIWKTFHSCLRIASRAPLLLCAAIASTWGYCAWSQSYWWRTLEANQFGWLTPIFVAYVLFARRRELGGAWGRATASGGTVQSFRLTVCAWFGFFIGVCLYLMGAIYRSGSGPTLRGGWLIATGSALLTLDLPIVSLSVIRIRSGSIRQDPRAKLASLLIFPALIWLLSEPQMTVVANAFSKHFLGAIARLVACGFNCVGSPIVSAGNTILLPGGGRLGVEEACSGIRSFLGCIFMSAFLGALLMRRVVSKILLMVIATILAVVFNLIRMAFLTAWAMKYGPRAIDGDIHDLAGYAVMVATILLLLAICSGSGHSSGAIKKMYRPVGPPQ